MRPTYGPASINSKKQRRRQTMSYQLASQDGPTPAATGARAADDFAFESLVGDSPALLDVIAFAKKVARRPGLTVLLVGETGTGKGVLARGIHYASPTANEPFVAVNCAAIPAALLESELFGHEEGAFTDARARKEGLMELAGTGVLFLDEVSELPSNLQPKLLRALEERRFRRLGGLEEIEIGCRIIAATHTSLEEAVTDGTFREDLFYRLNVLRIRVPPLRERIADVANLARNFLEELSKEQGFGPRTLGPDAVEALEGHTWPGNVRELKNVVQRGAVSADGPWIRADDIVLDHRAAVPSTVGGQLGRHIAVPETGMSLADLEAEAVRMTLEITRGNQSAAARVLGISRPTLVRKIRKYSLRHLTSAVPA